MIYVLGLNHKKGNFPCIGNKTRICHWRRRL